MPMVRSPWTLLWPRTGQAPAPGRPMLPRSSRKLTTSRIVATALLVLGQAHRPADDDALGPSTRRRLLDLLRGRPVASSSAQSGRQALGRLEAGGALVDERVVERGARRGSSRSISTRLSAGEEGQVPVDPDRQEQVRELGAARQAARLCGFLNRISRPRATG